MGAQRITFVINGLGAGGAERNLTTLANVFAKEGYLVTLITFTEELPFFQLHPSVIRHALGLSTKAAPGLNKLLRLSKLMWALRRKIGEIKPGVVVSFMDQANMITLLACLGSGVKVVVAERADPKRVSIHEFGGLATKLLFLLRNILYRRAYRVVVQTLGAANFFSFLKDKVVVIPNPVIRADSTHGPDIALPRPCIIGLGRLVPQKRFDLLISAFGAILEAHPEWSLCIVGSGPLANKLQTGVTKRIHFFSSTKTPHALFSQAEIFVQTSDYEGFPTALSEAMSSGCCVVATDCDFGPRDLIKNNKNGVLIPCNDAKALSTVLTDLIADPAKRKTLGSDARSVTERFTLEKTVTKWKRCLEL